MHFAAIYNNDAAVFTLLDKGASAKSVDIFQRMPHEYLKNENDNIYKILFKASNLITINHLNQGSGSLKNFVDSNHLQQGSGSLKNFVDSNYLNQGSGSSKNFVDSNYLNQGSGSSKNFMDLNDLNKGSGSLKNFVDEPLSELSTGDILLSSEAFSLKNYSDCDILSNNIEIFVGGKGDTDQLGLESMQVEFNEMKQQLLSVRATNQFHLDTIVQRDSQIHALGQQLSQHRVNSTVIVDPGILKFYENEIRLLTCQVAQEKELATVQSQDLDRLHSQIQTQRQDAERVASATKCLLYKEFEEYKDITKKQIRSMELDLKNQSAYCTKISALEIGLEKSNKVVREVEPQISVSLKENSNYSASLKFKAVNPEHQLRPGKWCCDVGYVNEARSAFNHNGRKRSLTEVQINRVGIPGILGNHESLCSSSPTMVLPIEISVEVEKLNGTIASNQIIIDSLIISERDKDAKIYALESELNQIAQESDRLELEMDTLLPEMNDMIAGISTPSPSNLLKKVQDQHNYLSAACLSNKKTLAASDRQIKQISANLRNLQNCVDFEGKQNESSHQAQIAGYISEMVKVTESRDNLRQLEFSQSVELDQLKRVLKDAKARNDKNALSVDAIISDNISELHERANRLFSEKEIAVEEGKVLSMNFIAKSKECERLAFSLSESQLKFMNADFAKTSFIELQKLFSDLDNECQQLKKSIELYVIERNTHIICISDLQVLQAQAQKDALTAMADITKGAAEKNELNMRFIDMEAHLEMANNNLACTEKTHLEYIKQQNILIESKDKTIESLSSELHNLGEKSACFETEIFMLRSEISNTTIKTELISIKNHEDLLKVNNEFNVLEDSKRVADIHLKLCIEKLNESNQSKEHLLSQLDSTRSANDANAEENIVLKSSLLNSANQLSDRFNMITSLEANLVNQDLLLKIEKSDNIYLKTEATKLNSIIDGKEMEINTFALDIEGFKKHIKQKDRELSEHKLLLETAGFFLFKLDSKLFNATAECSQLEVEVTEKSLVIEKAQLQILVLNTDISTIKSSQLEEDTKRTLQIKTNDAIAAQIFLKQRTDLDLRLQKNQLKVELQGRLIEKQGVLKLEVQSQSGKRKENEGIIYILQQQINQFAKDTEQLENERTVFEDKVRNQDLKSEIQNSYIHQQEKSLKDSQIYAQDLQHRELYIVDLEKRIDFLLESAKKLSIKSGEIEDLQLEILGLNNLLSEATKETNTFKEENELLNQRISEKNLLILSCEEEASKLNRINSLSIVQNNADLERLSDQVSELKDESSCLKESLESLTSIILSKDELIAILETEKDALYQKGLDLLSDVELEQEESEAKDEIILKLKSELEHRISVSSRAPVVSLAEFETFKSEITDLKYEIEKKTVKITELLKTITKLQNNINMLQEQMEDMLINPTNQQTEDLKMKDAEISIYQAEKLVNDTVISQLKVSLEAELLEKTKERCEFEKILQVEKHCSAEIVAALEKAYMLELTDKSEQVSSLKLRITSITEESDLKSRLITHTQAEIPSINEIESEMLLLSESLKSRELQFLDDEITIAELQNDLSKKEESIVILSNKLSDLNENIVVYQKEIDIAAIKAKELELALSKASTESLGIKTKHFLCLKDLEIAENNVKSLLYDLSQSLTLTEAISQEKIALEAIIRELNTNQAALLKNIALSAVDQEAQKTKVLSLQSKLNAESINWEQACEKIRMLEICSESVNGELVTSKEEFSGLNANLLGVRVNLQSLEHEMHLKTMETALIIKENSSLILNIEKLKRECLLQNEDIKKSEYENEVKQKIVISLEFDLSAQSKCLIIANEKLKALKIEADNQLVLQNEGRQEVLLLQIKLKDLKETLIEKVEMITKLENDQAQNTSDYKQEISQSELRFIKELSNTNKDFNNMKHEYTTQLENLQKALEKSESSDKVKLKAMAVMQSSILALNENAQEFETKIEDLNSQLALSKLALKSNKNSLENEIKDLRLDIKTSENDINNSNKSYITKITSLNTTIDDLESLKTKQSKLILDAQTKISLGDQMIVTLNAQVENLTLDIANNSVLFSVKRSDLEQEIKKLNSDSVRFSQELVDIRKTYEEKLASSARDLINLDDGKSKKAQINLDLQAKISSLNRLSLEHQQEFEIMQKEFAASIADSKAVKIILETQIRQLRGEISASGKELSDFRAANENEIQTYKLTISNLEDNQQKNHKASLKLQSAFESLSQKSIQIEKQMELLQTEYAESIIASKATKVEMSSQIKLLKDNLTASELQVSKAVSETQNELILKQKLQHEKIRLEEYISNGNEITESIHIELGSLRSEKKKTNDAYRNLQNENEARGSTIEGLNLNLKHLNDKAIKLEKSAEVLHTEIETLSEARIVLTENIAVLKKSEETQNGYIDDLKLQIVRLEGHAKFKDLHCRIECDEKEKELTESILRLQNVEASAKLDQEELFNQISKQEQAIENKRKEFATVQKLLDDQLQETSRCKFQKEKTESKLGLVANELKITSERLSVALELQKKQEHVRQNLVQKLQDKELFMQQNSFEIDCEQEKIRATDEKVHNLRQKVKEAVIEKVRLDALVESLKHEIRLQKTKISDLEMQIFRNDNSAKVFAVQLEMKMKDKEHEVSLLSKNLENFEKTIIAERDERSLLENQWLKNRKQMIEEIQRLRAYTQELLLGNPEQEEERVKLY